jgi:hypothetical protein
MRKFGRMDVVSDDSSTFSGFGAYRYTFFRKKCKILAESRILSSILGLSKPRDQGVACTCRRPQRKLRVEME